MSKIRISQCQRRLRRDSTKLPHPPYPQAGEIHMIRNLIMNSHGEKNSHYRHICKRATMRCTWEGCSPENACPVAQPVQWQSESMGNLGVHFVEGSLQWKKFSGSTPPSNRLHTSLLWYCRSWSILNHPFPWTHSLHYVHELQNSSKKMNCRVDLRAVAHLSLPEVQAANFEWSLEQCKYPLGGPSRLCRMSPSGIPAIELDIMTTCTCIRICS